MRVGRRVLIGRERVDDVTTHPAFRNAAQTVADLYDQKADLGKPPPATPDRVLE